ncbi:beta-ketoacyl-ACP reductase [Neobacillus sp. MM2021_6]|uniref:beta-ketoacyl-ACP reductase n=1 Tax=Bacillaceae TaxID=186817 RepID=UPI0014088FEF|nr:MULTISPECIES: beta-ketoacyl-ACP reductase [Bacillaceae]MBO0960060.1 beta-ketoacyl-ACP reductase [Neobacillus sp. MM2021_6]NHC21275.1 beta-ketoacyl-ACP reductase [Bacillus sp. MM2020_4]
MKLEGKVAIITGGAGGLGKETCLLFSSEGAHVVVADYHKNLAEETAREINGLGLGVDVSQRCQVDRMVNEVLEQYGKIDILINNAGITQDSTLVKMTEEQWNQVVSINQTGVFHCTQAVVPHMVKEGFGKIINTSSIVGRMGNFGQTNYAATKAAVIAMTQTWAKELGRKGINVNAVAPGFIMTPMTEKMPEKVLTGMKEKVSLQRLGTPRDIANTYLFLASDDASYINGAVIPVDGGLSI